MGEPCEGPSSETVGAVHVHSSLPAPAGVYTCTKMSVVCASWRAAISDLHVWLQSMSPKEKGDVKEMITFIMKMLKLYPSERPTAEDLLMDPFFSTSSRVAPTPNSNLRGIRDGHSHIMAFEHRGAPFSALDRATLSPAKRQPHLTEPSCGRRYIHVHAYTPENEAVQVTLSVTAHVCRELYTSCSLFPRHRSHSQFHFLKYPLCHGPPASTFILSHGGRPHDSGGARVLQQNTEKCNCANTTERGIYLTKF